MYDLAVAKLTETGLRGAIPELWMYAIHRRVVSTVIRTGPSHTPSLWRWAPVCHIRVKISTATQILGASKKLKRFGMVLKILQAAAAAKERNAYTEQ